MAINNQPTIKPRTVTGLFTKYIPKVIPLAFDESMSYYECLCALLDYINKNVIPALDNNAEGLLELQEFYLELQNYVNDYLRDETIQPLINNILDKYVEDGTLENILAKYINEDIKHVYNSLELLKQADLDENTKVQTYGYYSLNDGGGANYIIRNIAPDGYYETLDNGKFAELIIQDVVNVKQFGAYGDKQHNDTSCVINAIDYLNNIGGTIYFPRGKYILDYLPIKNNVNYIGESYHDTYLYTSSNTSGHFIYLDDAVVQHMKFEGFRIVCENTSNRLIGIDIDAFEQSEAPYTGGLWHAEFKNLIINNFFKGIKCEAIDNQGDLANQFISFDHVNVYRPGLNVDERCAILNAQLGQALFTTCVFQSNRLDGAQYNLSVGTNVEIAGVGSGNRHIDFINCSFQNSSKGVIATGIINFESCWFENLSQSITCGTNSTVKVMGTNFANAGYVDGTNGYIIKGAAGCDINISNNQVGGRLDKFIVSNNAYLITNKNNHTTGITDGLVKQLSVSNDGSLTVHGYESMFVNANETTDLITIITDRLTTNEEITLVCLANGSAPTLRLSTGGNLILPGNNDKIILHRYDTVTLKYNDINNRWFVKSISKGKVYSTVSPAENESLNTHKFYEGDIFYNSSKRVGNPVAWVCAIDGTPGTWRKYGEYSD